MSQLILNPVSMVSGDIVLPGSKSVSNRALLLAALARGSSTIANMLVSDDTRFMVDALRQLGVAISVAGTTARVSGAGGPLGDGSDHTLYLGLAGTAYRPLAAALTLSSGRYVLDGEPRMRERPVGHLVDALQLLGARIRYLGAAGYPPVEVTGTGLRGGETHIRGDVSSQFLSSLLLAAPLADGPVAVHIDGDLVSKPYLDITLDVMARFGATVTNTRYRRFDVRPGGYTSPGRFLVEGDASSASYFLAAGAIRGRGVNVRGIGSTSVQGDVAFVDVLRQMGARVSVEEESIAVAGGGRLKAVDLDLNHIPDAAMTVAVLALFAEGTTRIRNVYNWRVKETDRLSAMATELRKLGAVVVEGEDFIEITPPQRLQPAVIDTYGDHRMAMAFSLACLGGVTVTINDPEVVSKTFPDYFDRFAEVCARAA